MVQLSEEQQNQKSYFDGNLEDLDRALQKENSLEDLKKFDLNRIEFSSKKQRNKYYQMIYYKKKREKKQPEAQCYISAAADHKYEDDL